MCHVCRCVCRFCLVCCFMKTFCGSIKKSAKQNRWYSGLPGWSLPPSPPPPRGTEAAAALWIHRLGVWRILCWLLHRGFSEILGNCARDSKGPPDILRSRALCFLSRLEKVSTTLYTTAFWASSFDTDSSFVTRSVPTSRQKLAHITLLSQIKWI